MDIKELKNNIEKNKLNKISFIFKYTDNSFLCNQYTNTIAKNKRLTKLYINSLNEINSENDFFNTSSNYLYVLNVEKFDEYLNPDLNNIIVITKEIAKDIQVDYIEFPKLINWQIEDYIKMRLPGLSTDKISWLCNIAKYDIYRLDKECAKLEIFNKVDQELIFQQMNNDNSYSDLNSLTIFNFTNALLKKDFNILREILSDLKNIDIEGTGLLTLMHRNIKNVIDIQMNSYATAESLGMNPKQFNAIKYNCGKYTNDQLINIFEFLTSLDMKLKNGELAFKDSATHLTINNMLVDYIVTNILTLGNN